MGVKELVACYVRVSTENQLENYSIDEQIDRLRAYCKAKDFDVYKMYVDGGYSGGNLNRPALKELLNDIDEKKVNMVIVYKLDRLSRSQKDTLNLIEDKFLAHDVNFLSVAENFDTSTAFGRAMIGILSVFAQLEKEQITERFIMGRIGRSKAGLYHGGPKAPTGYDYIDGKLVVNEFKAMQIREIYKKFECGYSINHIREYMDKKYSGWSNHSLILKVLRNSVYIGKVKFKGVEYEGLHEAIISESEYKKVQELLSERRHDTERGVFKAGYLLSGLLFCAKCSSKYSANHGYYKCYSRSKSNKKCIKDPNCKNKNWDINKLDSIIIRLITNLKIDNQEVEKFLLNDIKEFKGLQDYEEKRLKEIDNQINRLIDLYQMNCLDTKALSERLETLQAEKCILERRNDDKKRSIKLDSELNFGKVFEIGSLQEQRVLVKSLIESIEIDEDVITIKWLI